MTIAHEKTAGRSGGIEVRIRGVRHHHELHAGGDRVAEGLQAHAAHAHRVVVGVRRRGAEAGEVLRRRGDVPDWSPRTNAAARRATSVGSLENVRLPRKLRGESSVSATGAKSMSMPARRSAAAVARASVSTCAAPRPPSARADAAGAAQGSRRVGPPSWSTASSSGEPPSQAAAFSSPAHAGHLRGGRPAADEDHASHVAVAHVREERRLRRLGERGHDHSSDHAMERRSGRRGRREHATRRPAQERPHARCASRSPDRRSGTAPGRRRAWSSGPGARWSAGRPAR